MGYNFEIQSSRIIIKDSSLSALFGKMKEVMSDEMMSRFAIPDNYSSRNHDLTYHYSWVDTFKARNAAKNRDLIGFFAEWGYDLTTDDEDEGLESKSRHYNLNLREGSSKIGDEDILFFSIAPCIENGSFIECRGEDGECWRWHWHDGKFFNQTAISVLYGNASKVVLTPRK